MRRWWIVCSVLVSWYVLSGSSAQAAPMLVPTQLPSPALGGASTSLWKPPVQSLLSPLQWNFFSIASSNAAGSNRGSRSSSLVMEPPPVVQHQRVAMGILTGWSVASIGTGIALLFSQDSMVRDFGVQQIAWGAVDLIIATISLIAQARQNPATIDLKKQQKDFRFALWLNTGLDVLYMIAGVLMMTVWKKTLAGHGAGILVQGGFLFGFDLINALLTYRY